MMFEADIHILQTTTVTYRLEYENPVSVEAFVFDENTQNLIDYVITCDIQSSFYNYYSIKDKVKIFIKKIKIQIFFFFLIFFK